MKYYYRDPDYGDWVTISTGAHPERVSWDTMERASSGGVNHRINPPPDGNPAWYIGDGLQWRKEPVRTPGIGREGMHTFVGLFNAALLAFNPVAAAIVFVGFLAYEITEGLRIRDWAYRDIGGHLIGFAVGSTILVCLQILSWLAVE